MKKLFLAIIAMGSIAPVKAQAPKDGSILIYGNIGFSSSKTKDDPGTAGATVAESKESSFNINPGIGYQFNRNWTAGLNIGYSTGKNEDADATVGTVKTTDLAIGPFIRHTHILSNTFFIFNQLNLNYLSGKDRLELPAPAPDFENTYKGFGANWFPAIGISVNNTVALNFQFGGLSYENVDWDIDASQQTIETSGFDFTFGQQASIGISVNLGGRKMRTTMEPGTDRRIDTTDDNDE